MRLEIIGRDLPGRSCKPGGENVHVGIQRRREVVEQIAGDAPSARWSFDCQTLQDGGRVDLRGPYIQGRAGARFIYLSWGVVTETGEFQMFRRAKLQLDGVAPEILRKATRPGSRLVGALRLTDERGGPRCSSVRPPNIEWSVVD